MKLKESRRGAREGQVKVRCDVDLLDISLLEQPTGETILVCWAS